MRITNKQMKPESFHIRTGSFLYYFFFFFKHFSYIYWFSSSSFREHSQMCKATSNSNISWSKKWNLHLTAFFNNVQSPFNRKMEQSANRKRKGLIKTHQSWSWRFPCHGNMANTSRGAPRPGRSLRPCCWHRHVLRSLEQGAEVLLSLSSTNKHRQNRGRSTEGRDFLLIGRALSDASTCFPFCSQSKANAWATQSWILLAS